MNKKNKTAKNFMALSAAFIWGTSFVAQSVGAESMPPAAFNTFRFIVAFAFLLIFCTIINFIREKNNIPSQANKKDSCYVKNLLLGGGLCGLCMAAAAFFQQKGLETTSPGKAGFITSLYIVIIPLAELFMKKKPSKMFFLSIPLAVAGLYCLCVTESFSIVSGDVYILICAFCFAGQILVIDRFTEKVNGTELSCVQFFIAAILSTIIMLFTELPTAEGILECALPLLYLGIMASGVAYTLQILAQKDSDPTVISLLLSLESVFAVLAGAVFLGDNMTLREYIGCALMLFAVILAQITPRTSS
jgi:drug/metabolite transporter (DMT)-like permease